FRHVLPSALVPLVGYLGPALAGIMTGSLIVELIFNLPGGGRYFVQGALNRDYPLVMGVVIICATCIILFNLLSDLAYAALAPRVRKSYRCARTRASWAPPRCRRPPAARCRGRCGGGRRAASGATAPP